MILAVAICLFHFIFTQAYPEKKNRRNRAESGELNSIKDNILSV